MNQIKKIAAVLAAGMLFSATAPVFAEKDVTFSDISDEKYSWAVGYIEEMAAQGFINGYPDGTYKPDNSVTRLEVLSLFARAMGSTSDANAKAVEAAVEQYSDAIAKYDLPYGESDISYLLYRGALKESELATYLKGELKNQAMPRYEAAAIITKAMCAEEAATSEIMVDLEYTDAKAIPSKAIQYVYYVTEKGIMSGMGDGSFSPASGVLRSQIAVMLSKTVDLMYLTVEELKIVSVDEDNIAYKDSEGETGFMGYNDQTRFYLEGLLTQAKNIPVGVWGQFTYVDNELKYVDIAENIPDETVEGIYDGHSSSNGVVSITIKNQDGEKVVYPLAETITIQKEGADATIRDFTASDYVIAEVSGGKIVSLSGEEKEKVISNVTIEEVSIISDGTITISHAEKEYDGLVLPVRDDITVKKNGESADLSEIYKGDIATITLIYGEIKEIKAQSNTKTVEGTIQAIEISQSPKMTVSVKNQSNVYDIPAGVEINVNGEKGSLYDFRIGDSVVLTLESQAIIRIVTTSAKSSSYSQTGTITAINSSYGFIKISYINGDATSEETVYCKDATTKIVTSEGKEKALKDLKVGNTVTVRGTMANGAFEASLILLEVTE